MADDTEPGVDLAALDFTRPVADLDAIRAVNPQRHEMEMLSGVAVMDTATHFVVGWKDVRADEFWARGHMPVFPLLPGVLMCEAAAQLCCFYSVANGFVDRHALQGLGGLEKARFYRAVRPGDRLVLVAKGLRVHRRMTRFQVKGYVGTERAFEVEVVGVSLGKWEDLVRA